VAQAAPQPAPQAEPQPAPAPAVAAQNTAESQRPATRERKTRQGRSGRMLERTIEFSDGRRVTITHPIGRGGTKAAREALDRAAARELAGEETDGRRERSVEPRTIERPPTRRVDTRQRPSELEQRREKAWYEPDDDEPELETRLEPRRRNIVVETRRPREREWYEPD
jgi:hypothetical protein